MGMLLSLFQGLKAEISWFFSALTYAAADTPPADTPADNAQAANDAQTREHGSDDQSVTLANLVHSDADSAQPHPQSHDADIGDFLHHVKAETSLNDDSAPQAEQGGQLLTSASIDFSAAQSATTTLDSLSHLNAVTIEAFAPHKIDTHDDISFSVAPLYGNDLAAVNSGAVFSFAHGAGGGGGGGGGGGTPPPPAPFTTTGALQITLNFDPSVGKAPAGFVSGIEYAAQYFSDHFSDPTHIYINVGYGEVDGFHIPASALGESISNTVFIGNYPAMYNALTGDAKSFGDDGRGLLPAPTGNLSTDPTGGGNFVISTAEAKALSINGLILPSVDGYVGFSSFKTIFDYNIGEKPASGQYDFVSVAAHEISEVMGRMLFVGGKVDGYSNSYDALDLFHFSSANGARIYSGTVAGYFSTDGKNTNADISHNFNTVSGGDYADWASGQVTDSFDAAGGSGALGPVHSFDIAVMDAIGWDWNGTVWNNVPT